MAEKLVKWALDNRVLVLILGVVLTAVGVQQAQRLRIDAVPDVTNVQVQILTKASALAPVEVESLVTFPVESAMAGIPDLEEIRSVSKFGLSVVTVVFLEGTDIYRARQLVQERLAEAREAIPEGYGDPEMGPIATGLGEIYQFEVRGDPACPTTEDTPDCYTPMELRTILDWFVAYQLKSVPGIVEVNTFGGELKTYEVQPDPVALRAHRLPLSELFEALERNNRNAGGAYLERNREQVVIRGEALLESLTDVENVVVRTTGEGTPIYVRDIAQVRLSPMVRQGVVTRDGQGEAVVGVVMMLMGENSGEVVERIKEKLESIQAGLPAGVTIEPFYDRTDLVDRTIETVSSNLLEGGLLVIAVLLLLLGNLRGGIIVAAAIPLSMIIAFIGMVQADVSGNLMSLGAIDFGIIVDGAVVMVENVVRVRAQRSGEDDDPQGDIRRATRQVARPVAFSVAIIVLVYIPILTLTGIEGKMFRPMAWTVMFALIASMVLALTVIPVLCSFFLRKKVVHKDTVAVRLARRGYNPLLRRAIRHPLVVVGIAAGLFVLSIGVGTRMGAEFIPKLDEGSIALQVWRLPSVSIDEAAKQSTALEAVLLEEFEEEVATVISKTGRPEIATDPMGVEMSDVFVILHPREQWRYDSKGELIEAMEEHLNERVIGAAFGFSQPIELRVSELISGVRSDIAIKVFGDDLDDLRRVAEDIARSVSQIDGASDVKVEQVSGLPILTIEVDQESIARHGVDADDVLDAVDALGGRKVGVILEGQKRFALQVRIPATVRNDLEKIRQFPIAGVGGRLVPLGELATIDVEQGAAQISRERIQRRITVELNVRGADISSVVSAAKQAIKDDVEMPPGFVLEWGGQFENLTRASERLAILVPIALLLIFALLYAAFNAARPAVLIFLNVPLAASGGVLALAVRGMPFSISAGVGFIALFGIAVMNGVVLVSYIRDLEQEGVAPRDAALEGAGARLRPVLMTALTDLIGFLPMAVATGAGAEVQRPLATVVIGGLITATFLTMFVLPAIYARGAVATKESTE
ncbi:MAG: efflux RND transporter permease subunit [Nannocystales bacterium]